MPGRATEDGIIPTDYVLDIPMGAGQEPAGPRAHLQIDLETGEVTRKAGWEHQIITDLRPERPA
jgi:hypothetical protein